MGVNAILSKATAKHCVAIMPCSPFKVILYGSDNHNDGQGTLTLVELDNRLYGVTNEHVVNMEDNQLTDFLVVLKNHTFIHRKPIFTSNLKDMYIPYDIAIFELDDIRDEFHNYGKQGISLSSSKLREDEIFLAVGFPGELRATKEGGIMAHPLAHIAITCRGFSEYKITGFNGAEELEYVERMDFGGISGGALFKVLDDETPDYELVGICYEGRGTKPEDSVAENDPHSDIWIFGYPLSEQVFGEMLNSSKQVKNK